MSIRIMVPAGWLRNRVTIWCGDVGRFYYWREWLSGNIDSSYKLQCGWFAGEYDGHSDLREMTFSDEAKWAAPRSFFEFGPGMITTYFAEERDATLFKLACGG